jgi:hemolysin-activating ACP:hemolysin acyltransferase
LPQTGHSLGPPDISLGRLKMLMRRDPSALDAALIEISQRLLPNVENPQGTLYVLAGE